jgi:hypothetical protein
MFRLAREMVTRGEHALTTTTTRIFAVTMVADVYPTGRARASGGRVQRRLKNENRRVSSTDTSRLVASGK